MSWEEEVTAVATEITVELFMQRGEGDWPNLDELSETETRDPARMCTFTFPYEVKWMLEESGARLTSCELIYDGVSHCKTMKYGVSVDGGRLKGRPSPVIKCRFSKAVPVADFKTAVALSTVLIRPRSRGQNCDDRGYVCGNEGVETSVLSERELVQLIAKLRRAGLYSGKPFTMRQMLSGVRLHNRCEPARV